MISKFFVDRPIFANVIAILTVLGGIVCIFILPISQYPEVVPPTVTVSTLYPGADPQVVADTVAAPIEQQVNGVEGMIYMSSNCNRDGSYNLTVTFALGTDVDMAQVLVQNRVSMAQAQLPNDVKRQGITVDKKSVNFVTIGSLLSPDKRYDNLYLVNYATLNIKDELSRIPGVGSVSIYPSNKDYSMRIWMDPNKLQARNMTVNDVTNALTEQNVQVAAGQIGQPPAPSKLAFQYTVTTLGRLTSVNQFQDIILKTSSEGRITRVKDVARVELGGQTYDTTSYMNGAPSCTILVYQLPGSNALDVATQVNKKMAELTKSFPAGLEYRLNYDVSDFVRASLKEVVKTLIEAFILVALVVFIFLQNFRAMLIPMTTIPVSLIGTFMVMYFMGFSINTLTMFGLVLAIGITVDDAIVVVENVTRVMDEDHLAPREATIKAMGEITGPIIGITLVLMAVFLPTSFLPGISGQMYRQFALTIAVTTLISAINAMTLKPAQSAMFLRPRTGKPNFFTRGFNNTFDKITHGYTGVVKMVLRRSAIALLLYVGLVGMAGLGFMSLPTGFIPMEDQGLVFINIQLPESASMARNDVAAAKAYAAIKDIPGVQQATFLGGYSMLDGTVGSNLGSAFVILKPWDERYSKENIATQNLNAIVMRMRIALSKIQDGEIVAFPPPAILGLGNAGGFQMQVLDKRNLGLGILEEGTTSLVQEAHADPDLTGVNTRFKATSPQLFADVNRTKVKMLNVPLQSVFDAMQGYLGSAYVNDFNEFGRVYQVRIQADSQFRAIPDDIKRLYVRSNTGKMVPLSTLVKVKEDMGPPNIVRYNLYPSSTINGEAGPGVSSGQALLAMEGLADQVLPPGIGYEWTGMSYQEKLVGYTAVIAFILAIVVVYLVLAAQYESWSNPFAVVLSVPTALFGAAAAIYIRHMDVNIFTQIGLVLLVALAAKNAILIVEFARDARAKGMPLREAATEGAKLRFRPILMTSFAFNLGVLPLVLATGAGAAGRAALGTAVFGGMIAATIFPIFFVPVLYTVCQGFTEWLEKRNKATPK
jgi:hydrophobic/amphiphilic exporter-1 (mainly G- bacteria), HAE1 family